MVNSFFKIILVVVSVLQFATYSASAQASDKKMTGLSLSKNDPVQIESNSLTIDEDIGQANFIGNVRVLQGDKTLQSGEMIVHYSKQDNTPGFGVADIREIDLSKKVLIRSGSQTATADTGNFNMQTETLTLLGERVVLTDDGNIFIGCKLTVEMKSGQATLDNCGKRVLIQLEPSSPSKQ